MAIKPVERIDIKINRGQQCAGCPFIVEASAKKLAITCEGCGTVNESFKLKNKTELANFVWEVCVGNYKECNHYIALMHLYDTGRKK